MPDTATAVPDIESRAREFARWIEQFHANVDANFEGPIANFGHRHLGYVLHIAKGQLRLLDVPLCERLLRGHGRDRGRQQHAKQESPRSSSIISSRAP